MLEVLAGLIVLAAAIAGQLLLVCFRTVPRARRRADSPTVAVVIPARNEGRSLPRLLTSLDRQSVRPAVIVVDDESDDDTSAIAAAHGAQVLAPGSPPDGWTGKAWACRAGAVAADADMLLFLDADTCLAPDAVAGLLALHRRHAGLVSVQPYHRVRRPHEQLSAYFNAVSVMASAVFAVRPNRRPMCFGPCLLTTRRDYERVGGHDAVKAAVLDDVGLAAAYAGSGLPVTCVAGGHRIVMRSYPDGVGQLASGWIKNMASGAGAADRLAAAGATLWICAHHVVAVGTIAALAHPLRIQTAIWSAAWIGEAVHFRSILRRLGSFGWWAWLLFPLPLLAFDLLFVRSSLDTVVRRSVRWRGRPVDLGTGRRGGAARAHRG